MQVIVEVRREMLEIIKDSLEHASSPKIIVFKDSSDIVLAQMPFLQLDAFGTDAQYQFKALDGGTSLKASVITSGRVSEFTIDGELPSGGQAEVLSGSVGGLNSDSDIRFNRRDWSESGVITLNNLILILRQGQN